MSSKERGDFKSELDQERQQHHEVQSYLQFAFSPLTVAAWILWLVALVFFAAFFSLYAQIPGLYARNGNKFSSLSTARFKRRTAHTHTHTHFLSFQIVHAKY